MAIKESSSIWDLTELARSGGGLSNSNGEGEGTRPTSPLPTKTRGLWSVDPEGAAPSQTQSGEGLGTVGLGRDLNQFHQYPELGSVRTSRSIGNAFHHCSWVGR